MSRNKTEKKNMGFCLVFAGTLFLSNPCVNLFDIFPDIIGALLVYAGLRKASLADEYFADARKISFYMIWLYAIKLVFSFFVLKNAQYSLPYTFISATLEIIILVAFFQKLFSGFEYTSMRTSLDKAPFGINEVYLYTLIFVIAKNVIVFLPEIFELFSQGDSSDISINATYYMSLLSVKKYAVVLGVFIQLTLGIIFIVQMKKFFSALKKDSHYLCNLNEKYQLELSLNKSKYLINSLNTSYLFLLLSAIFIVDFYIEGIDIFPDVLGSVLLVVCLFIMKSRASYLHVNKSMCILLTISGALSSVLSIFTRPEYFELMSQSFSYVKNHSIGFFKQNSGTFIYLLISALYALCIIWAIVVIVGNSRTVFSNERLGNHDRKLLSVGSLFGITVILKAITTVLDSLCAMYATKPSVAEFISDRTRMTKKMMDTAISSDTNISAFNTLENASFVFSLAIMIFAVFTVFNIISLKAQITKKD